MSERDIEIVEILFMLAWIVSTNIVQIYVGLPYLPGEDSDVNNELLPA